MNTKYNSSDLQKAILSLLKEKIADNWVNIRDIQKELFDCYSTEDVDKIIAYLSKVGFVEKLHETLDGDFNLSITSKGLHFIENGVKENNSPNIIIGSVSNSNISINSTNIKQFIESNKIQNEEVIEKLGELEEAMRFKDKIKLKNILAWLADKALDVLLPILISGLKV